MVQPSPRHSCALPCTYPSARSLGPALLPADRRSLRAAAAQGARGDAGARRPAPAALLALAPEIPAAAALALPPAAALALPPAALAQPPAARFAAAPASLALAPAATLQPPAGSLAARRPVTGKGKGVRGGLARRSRGVGLWLRRRCSLYYTRVLAAAAAARAARHSMRSWCSANSSRLSIGLPSCLSLRLCLCQSDFMCAVSSSRDTNTTPGAVALRIPPAAFPPGARTSPRGAAGAACGAAGCGAAGCAAVSPARRGGGRG